MVNRFTLFLLPALLCIAATALAEDATALRNSPGEWAVLSGYGLTHRGFGATRTQVQTFDAILRYGHFLSGDMGSGWYRGRHELLLELPLHVALDHDGRTMSGGYVLGSWKFTTSETVAPYLFAGGGILFNDLGLKTQGTRLNYSYQGGFGLQSFLSRTTALGMEYRYHHVSNAGTAEPNEPLNSSKVLFSISFFR
jgi:hypothetical protein